MPTYRPLFNFIRHTVAAEAPEAPPHNGSEGAETWEFPLVAMKSKSGSVSSCRRVEEDEVELVPARKTGEYEANVSTRYDRKGSAGGIITITKTVSTTSE